MHTDNNLLVRIICSLLIVATPSFAQVLAPTTEIVVVGKPYPKIFYFPEEIRAPINNNFPTQEAQERYFEYVNQAAIAAADLARNKKNECIDQAIENSKVGAIDSAAKVVLLAESHSNFSADDYEFVVQDIAAGDMNRTCFAIEQPHEIVTEIVRGSYSYPAEYISYVESLRMFDSWGMKTFGIDTDVPYTTEMQAYMSSRPGEDWTDLGPWNQVPLSVTGPWLDARDNIMQANINTLLGNGCQKVIALVGTTHVTGAEARVERGERKVENYGSGLLKRLTDAGIATQAVGLSAAAKKCLN